MSLKGIVYVCEKDIFIQSIVGSGKIFLDDVPGAHTIP